MLALRYWLFAIFLELPLQNGPLITRSLAETPPGYSPATSRGLDLIYSDHLHIHPALRIAPADAFDLPKIREQGLLIFQPYIVFMIDIDVNHAGVATTMLHWYQPSCYVSDIGGTLSNRTDDGAHYVGPQPPPGSSHTYVFLLFRQPSDYAFPPCFSGIFPISVPTRSGFNILQFMRVAGLDSPVAANYFSASNSERVATTQVVTSTSLRTAVCGPSTTN